MRKNILWLIILPVFLFPQIAIACGYCNGNGPHNGGGNYHNGMGYNYNSNDVKSMKAFDAKRAELNRLYDQGVKDDDKRVQALVKELDAMSGHVDGHMKRAYQYGPCPAGQNGQHRYQGSCR